MLPVVQIEVRSSGNDGLWNSNWGVRRVSLAPRVLGEWCDKAQVGNKNGVAIIIRRES